MKNNLFSEELVRRLSCATHVTVCTGAGVSAESGISTFRDPGGIWTKFKPHELANVEAFLSNPMLVQEWYRARKRIATEAEPNPGHEAIAHFEQHLNSRGKGFAVVTQNVDNLHSRAGNEHVIELHGNITRNYCFDCKEEASDEDMARQNGEHILTCSRCTGLIRPDVVWFGEQLPPQAIEQAFEIAQKTSVLLSVGTSSVVYPAAHIPLVARDHGAYVAEINVEHSDIASHLDEVILGKSGEVLPALFTAYKEAVLSSEHAINGN